MPPPDQQAPSPPSTAQSSAAQSWAAQCCSYRDMLFKLSEAGTDMAMEVAAAPRSPAPDGAPLLEIAALFDRLSRSVRLTVAMARRLDPDAAAAIARPSPPKPSQAAPPKPAAPNKGDHEPGDRLEDPLREHNLNRPMPELIDKVVSGFGPGGKPAPDAAKPAVPPPVSVLHYTGAAETGVARIPPANPKPTIGFKPSG